MDWTGVETRGNRVLLHIPKRVEDTLWVGGRELYFDGTFAEHFNKKLGGVVMAVPPRLGDEYLLERRAYVPKIVPCSDILDDLQPGDVVYADWTVTEPHFEVQGMGGFYWATLNQVVARVREGVLTPYGSYVLLKEVFPPDVEPVTVEGHTLQLRVSASGLALGSESIPPLRYQGEVAHVGLPLRGQRQRVQVGERAVFDKRYCAKHDGLPLRMKIEGQEYLCIRQDYIEAVLEEAGSGETEQPAGSTLTVQTQGKTLAADTEQIKQLYNFRQRQNSTSREAADDDKARREFEKGDGRDEQEVHYIKEIAEDKRLAFALSGVTEN